MTPRQREAWEKALKVMMGARIVGTGVSADGFPWFCFEWPDGSAQVMQLSQDDEGNGPGALLGLWELSRSKGA